MGHGAEILVGHEMEVWLTEGGLCANLVARSTIPLRHPAGQNCVLLPENCLNRSKPTGPRKKKLDNRASVPWVASRSSHCGFSAAPRVRAVGGGNILGGTGEKSLREVTCLLVNEPRQSPGCGISETPLAAVTSRCGYFSPRLLLATKKNLLVGWGGGAWGAVLVVNVVRQYRRA